MDTTVWGPILWSLAFDVAKFCDPADSAVEAYFSSWRYVLPCIHCRSSYRKFYASRPPPTGPRSSKALNASQRREKLHAWLHWLRSNVCAKLNRQKGLPEAANVLPLKKSELRREVWSYYGSEGWFWDHWYLLACNYSVDAENPKSDAEREKLPGYAVYVDTLVRLSEQIPYAKSAVEPLRKTVWSRALRGRSPLLLALHEASVSSGYERRTADEIERTYSKCDPSRH
jgi:hypothetical protein